ncbi:WD40/YVTN/BNR-like repeat-containing protein [Thalassotalea atypica]|uniref:WD40/YVTN/BNR-like repeat-containing protein n=1 Tax=Thalassotalea atypica TaxID=2054316 RepID=UPI0025732D67|nr:YCF48-related protein [Thalassotalea atypica]
MFFNKLQHRLLLAVILCFNGLAYANIDLLSHPAIQSKLAPKSVTTAIIPDRNAVLAVGERGHIIHWQDKDNWQQDLVPLSIMLSSVTSLADGTSVAVGQDAAIVVTKGETASNTQRTWRKTFDGYELTRLKIALLEKQQLALQGQMEATADEDELEELEYQLDEVIFSLEDAQAEQISGPNKPLLSVTHTDNNTLFAVGAYGTLLRSDDLGVSWVLQDDLLDNPDKLHLNAIHYHNGTLYIVGESGLGFISTNNGKSWQLMELPYSGSIFGITGQENSNNLVAYGLQGNVMTSNNGGNTWSLVDLNISASILGGVVSDQGDAYLVGHGGIVVKLPLAQTKPFSIQKHPSGAAFSSVLIAPQSVQEDTENKHTQSLILAGQFGLVAWQFP